KGHRPIDEGEGHCESAKRKAWAAQPPEPAQQAAVTGLVLRSRPPVQSARIKPPQKEKENGPDHEERHIQLNPFLTDGFSDLRSLRIDAFVKLAYTHRNRNKKNSQQEDCASSRLQDPPDAVAPRTANEVIKHENRQAAQSHTQPEQISKQIRSEKLLR